MSMHMSARTSIRMPVHTQTATQSRSLYIGIAGGLCIGIADGLYIGIDSLCIGIADGLYIGIDNSMSIARVQACQGTK